jgi:hypothetical protein
MKLSPFNLNLLQLQNPYMVMWWSAALPGFGHLSMGKYVQGFILVIWEFVANLKGNINNGIVLSMIGDFEGAKKCLDFQWLFLYIPVYVFTIWDVYSRTIDTNKLTLLAVREQKPIPLMVMGEFGLHGLKPVSKWKAVFLSLALPGLAQIYMQRLFTGFFSITVWLVACYYSKFPVAVYHTMLGDFSVVIDSLQSEWLLFIPSIYTFCLYDAILMAPSVNRYFETEQAEYLMKEYQHPIFPMPI